MSTIISESRNQSQEIYDLRSDFKSRSIDLINQKLDKELSMDIQKEKEKNGKGFCTNNKIKTYSAL